MEHTVLLDKNPSALGESCLDIWHERISRLSPDFERFHGLLNGPERSRALRFVNADAMRTFVLARGLLRTMLGCYLQCDPAGVEIVHPTSGKPAVDARLQFNLSHSGDRLLLAFTRDQPVGVDIQTIDPAAPWQEYVDQVFAAGDDPPHALAAEEGCRTFYRCWVMKEALVKAEGVGMARPFAAFPTSSDDPSQFPHGFFVEETRAAPDCVAAWAVRGQRPSHIRVQFR